MLNRWLVAFGIMVGLLGGLSSVLAHHASTLYEKTRIVTLSGTVTKYEFANPHARIFLDVKDEHGNVAKWVADPLRPRGYTGSAGETDSLKPGDQITVSGPPMQDGTKNLTIRKLVTPKGELYPEKAD